jgi:hypothetical protein
MTELNLYRVYAIERWNDEALNAAKLDREGKGENWFWVITDEYVTSQMLPDGLICDPNSFEVAKLQSLLSFERLESLRLARIEAGNGQLSLPVLEVKP